MFERLTALFGNPSGYTTPLPEADAAHAMGALLVRAAKADDAYLFEEIALIDKILSTRHDLNPVEAAKMRAECEVLEKAMPQTSEVAEILKGLISVEEREDTLRALWRVVFADGVKHEEEERVLHRIEDVLGVAPSRAMVIQAETKGET
jgi:uncharacterized tellurite resistance protein B-like protein